MRITQAVRPRYLVPAAPSRRGLDRRWLTIGGTAVAAVLTIVALSAIRQPPPVARGKIVVIENVDADVAGNGLDAIRDKLVDAAVRLADEGGGTVTLIAASGGPAQVAAVADLKVERDGEPETDERVRAGVVKRRVDDAIGAAKSVQLTTPGRNLLSLLTAAAEKAPRRGEPFTIYYVGFGLATVDPTDARVALAGEPAQAVDAVAKRLPKLTGAELHLVYPAAVVPQQPLNTITAAWRTEYWSRLAKAMGARVTEVVSDTAPAQAGSHAPTAPPIANVPDPTPPPPGPPHPDPPPVVLGGGSFKPDSDQFLDPGAVVKALAPLVAAWTQHPGGYVGAECTGRTAAIGPADTARVLSRRRAAQAAAVLKIQGLPVAAIGVGFDDPLPNYSGTDPHQRSVRCRLVPNLLKEVRR